MDEAQGWVVFAGSQVDGQEWAKERGLSPKTVTIVTELEHVVGLTYGERMMHVLPAFFGRSNAVEIMDHVERSAFAERLA